MVTINGHRISFQQFKRNPTLSGPGGPACTTRGARPVSSRGPIRRPPDAATMEPWLTSPEQGTDMRGDARQMRLRRVTGRQVVEPAWRAGG